MALTNVLEKRVSRKFTLVIALLLLGFVVFLVVAALMPERELPRGYRIETRASGQSVLLDASGNAPIADRSIELERVAGRWIIVKDDGRAAGPEPIRYYLVDSLSGEVTASTELVELLRVIQNSR